MEEKECCSEFDPEYWDNKTNTWENKPFLKDEVRQVFHMPLNFGKVLTRMFDKIKGDHNYPDGKDFLVLAYDPSPWKADLYMTIKKEIAEGQIEKMSGEFYSKVFDGAYKEIPKFCKQMEEWGKQEGKKIKKLYLHYPYCPRCAKKYGHNYIVAFAEIEK